MSPSPQTLPELLAGLATDIPVLLQKEVQLARAEASRALDRLAAAARQLAIGSAVAVGAIGVALAAMVSLLTAVLIAYGWEPAWASAAASAAVTAVAAITAWILLSSAMRALREAKSSLDSGISAVAGPAGRETSP
jgi:hypothetical protein